MAVKTYVFGSFQTNCYVITHNGKAIIIDPGQNSNSLVEELKDLEVVAILLTHAHIDHIDGVGNFNCPIYIRDLDKDGLLDKTKSLYQACGVNPSFDKNKLNIISFTGDCELEIDEFKFKCIATPGHTLGGTCYLYKDICFTGDTLFRCSVGRTDFYGGSESELTKSLEKLIEFLPNDTRIYPGHDDQTDMKFEKKYNLFLKRILNK